MNDICYLCGSRDNSVVFKEFTIPILRCKNCTHVFSSYEQDEHYDGYWEGQDESYDLDWWDLAHREVYSRFLEIYMSAPSGKILDVGCGLGFFVKTVGEKKPGWTALGYEMSSKAVQYANTTNNLPNVYAGMVQSSNLPGQSFDIITLWDVIEHIPKPHSLLNYLHSLLKPGGILFIQTPNFPIQLLKARLKVWKNGMKEGIHYLEAKDHINDYTRKTLGKLAQDTGFESPVFEILPPIASVSGGSGSLGRQAKFLYYSVTRWIWNLSLQTVFLNNTIFASLQKPKA